MADQSLIRARLGADQAPASTVLTRATVLTWGSGSFTINLDGAIVSSFTVLESMSSPNPGDVVAVLRYKSNILVIGTIVAPS